MPRTRALLGLTLCTLTAALTSVALTGCASSSSPAASSTSSSASKATGSTGSAATTTARPAHLCDLLSPAEAASVMGDSYGSPYEADGYCGFTGDTEKFDLNLSPTEVNWKTAVSIAKVQYTTLTPVSGVGDQAVAAPNFLQFRKGSLVFSIDDPDGDGSTGDKYIALAKIVLSHLG